MKEVKTPKKETRDQRIARYRKMDQHDLAILYETSQRTIEILTKKIDTIFKYSCKH